MFGSSNTGLSFGAPATSTASTQPAFGGFGATGTTANATSSFGGFGLGSTTNNPTTTNASSFGFGGPATSTATSQPTFGGFGSTAAPLSFGAPATSTATSQPAFAGFGSTAAAANTTSGFGGFGTSAGGTTFGAGTGSTGFGQTAGTNTGFGGFGSTNTANKPAFGASTGFGFGGSTSGAFGQQQQQQQNFAQPQPTLTLTLASTTSVPTSTEPTKTSTFVGLGGTQLTTATEKAAENVSKISILESTVPPEFIPLVENMKNFIDKQKHIRDENAHEHYYSDAILEIGTAISDVLKVKVNKIEIDLQRCEKLVENLKKDTNRLLNHGELAHRISKTDVVQSSGENSIPGSNQNNFINSSVHQYFNEIVEGFRTQMKKCESEILTLKSYCESSNDKLYSYEEITQIMKKQHDNFVLLAAKVYAIHEYANHLRAEEAKNKNCDSGSVVTAPARSSFGISQRNGAEFEGPSPFLSAKNYVTGFQK